MKGGSDWLSVVRSRGPVSYGSTYDKNLFTTFTNTGKFYGSQNELNKRGGGPSPKKRRPSKHTSTSTSKPTSKSKSKPTTKPTSENKLNINTNTSTINILDTKTNKTNKTINSDDSDSDSD